MRIMFDTNILVSLIFFPTPQINNFFNIIISKHRLVIPDYVINELRLVTKRKFINKCANLSLFFHELAFELVFAPYNELPDFPQVRDVKDTPILATAIIEGIDVFITGDKDFLALNNISKPKIMTIADFLAKF